MLQVSSTSAELNTRISRFIGTLVAPVAFAALLSLAAILVLIWVAARGQDDVAATSSSDLMNTVIGELRNDVGNLAYDHTWWDNAIANLIDQPDEEWASDNVGDYVSETFGISETFVISQSNQTLFAFQGGVPSRVTAEEYFGDELTKLIDAARAAPMAEPEPAIAFVENDGRFHLVAVSAFTPENPTPAQLQRHARPVLVHSFDMYGERLNWISETFGFDDLKLTLLPPEAEADRTSLSLENFSGEKIGWFNWQPPHPGSALFIEIIPWLVAGIMVLSALGYIFIRRVMHAARRMALDTQKLALKERQLAQTSKLAVMGEMAAGVVHELNQPLNIIRMATDLTQAKLQQSELGSESEMLRDQLELIDGQTRRMAETIQSMRTFSRDDYGRKIAFDVVQATDQVLNWMKAELSDGDISISLQAPPQCGRVYGEPSRFEQVIMNLILNARDAVVDHRKNGKIGTGKISIDIVDDPALDRVLMRVRDNGGGVPVEHLERLFEPFYTTKIPGEGTGLGLSISYGIITGMDGELSVQNHDTGAEFTISLPRIAPNNLADDASSAETAT